MFRITGATVGQRVVVDLVAGDGDALFLILAREIDGELQYFESSDAPVTAKMVDDPLYLVIASLGVPSDGDPYTVKVTSEAFCATDDDLEEVDAFPAGTPNGTFVEGRLCDTDTDPGGPIDHHRVTRSSDVESSVAEVSYRPGRVLVVEPLVDPALDPVTIELVGTDQNDVLAEWDGAGPFSYVFPYPEVSGEFHLRVSGGEEQDYLLFWEFAIPDDCDDVFEPDEPFALVPGDRVTGVSCIDDGEAGTDTYTIDALEGDRIEASYTTRFFNTIAMNVIDADDQHEESAEQDFTGSVSYTVGNGEPPEHRIEMFQSGFGFVPYDLDVEVVPLGCGAGFAPDPYESNGTVNTASVIPVDDPFAGGANWRSVLCPGDTDWYSLDIDENREMTVVVQYDNSLGDVVRLRLLDNSGGLASTSSGSPGIATVQRTNGVGPDDEAPFLLEVKPVVGFDNFPITYTVVVTIGNPDRALTSRIR